MKVVFVLISVNKQVKRTQLIYLAAFCPLLSFFWLRCWGCLEKRSVRPAQVRAELALSTAKSADLFLEASHLLRCRSEIAALFGEGRWLSSGSTIAATLLLPVAHRLLLLLQPIVFVRLDPAVVDDTA